ncbi:hypothetical protein ACIBD9_00010, partial [Micromonospora sp. NPDC050784]|uniref:hypothetical protein n=1 Tax=Micromonospora sp. NPDC050784 TaxID=3364281 RepID=UPI00378F6F27
APSEVMMRRLARSLQAVDEEQLYQSAAFFSSMDAAGILRDQAADLLESPADWLADTEEAAANGDDLARDALLLVGYLLGCFALLARRLDPSARTIERLGPLVALSVLLMVVAGTIGANNPKALEKINEYLSSPAGLIGIFLGATATAAGPMQRKRKPSKPLRGSGRPRRKVLRRHIRRK